MGAEITLGKWRGGKKRPHGGTGRGKIVLVHQLGEMGGGGWGKEVTVFEGADFTFW